MLTIWLICAIWRTIPYCFCTSWLLFSVQLVVIASIVTSGQLTYDEYVFPYWADMLGWSIALSSMLFVPIYAIYKFFSVPSSFKEVSKHTHKHTLTDNYLSLQMRTYHSLLIFLHTLSTDKNYNPNTNHNMLFYYINVYLTSVYKFVPKYGRYSQSGITCWEVHIYNLKQKWWENKKNEKNSSKHSALEDNFPWSSISGDAHIPDVTNPSLGGADWFTPIHSLACSKSSILLLSLFLSIRRVICRLPTLMLKSHGML